MGTIRLGLAVIGKAKFDGFEVIRVGPGTFARNHLPPYPHVFHGLDPGSILDLGRFV